MFILLKALCYSSNYKGCYVPYCGFSDTQWSKVGSTTAFRMTFPLQLLKKYVIIEFYCFKICD